MARTVQIQLTEPQLEFMQLDCTYPAFVAGYGSGKSYMMCLRAILDSMHARSVKIDLYEPTLKLCKKILVPTMKKVFNDLGIKYHYHKTDYVWTPRILNCGTIQANSLEDPDSIIGSESYRAHVDELDTLGADKAERAWNKVIARCRQWPRGLSEEHMRYSETSKRLEPHNQVSVYTTPEGFKFVYHNWKFEPAEGTGIVHGSTYSNPFLPDAYIKSLESQYPSALIRAYLRGQFVNMASGTVYSCYDRDRCDSKEFIQQDETLHIGQDFNVTKMASSIAVPRKGGKEMHFVDELTGLYDTPAVIETIKNRFPGHKIIIYPDASGNARKTVGASTSDIALFEEAGFEIRAKRAKTGGYVNPPVKDRIMSVNGALEHGKVFVNAIKCPTIAKCLEQQAYDKNGEPDKSGDADHQNDATGYLVVYEYPIVKPVIDMTIGYI